MSVPRQRHPVGAGRGGARAVLAVSLGALGLAVICAGALAAFGPPPGSEHLQYSQLVRDRDGQLLRAYATADGRWRLPVRLADVDPRFFDVLLAYEDKRFRSHHGVDPLALLRAAFQLVGSGRIRSGGSTLTMQVARLLEGHPRRSLSTKLRQIVGALALERVRSKEEIESLYVTLAPYGGNIEGIRAASLAYFGKEPRLLTLGEAALLVALPQSPERRRPDRFARAARIARDRVLDRYAALARVPAAVIARAKAEPVPQARRPMPLLAAHSADRARAAAPAATDLRLTIAARLQQSMEELARARVQTLAQSTDPHVSLAILAVDNATGEVLAHVGAPDFFDRRRAGQVDMIRALRSPGSTLKPFIYGMGFEDGLIHPQTLIDDRPHRYGDYAPRDFDSSFQGTVTVRQALVQSLNLPAIAVLDRLGADRLAARLGQAGAALVLPPGQPPGLAIGLGGVGIRLSDLVMLYGGVAGRGLVSGLHERLGTPAQPRRRLMSTAAAWYVADVLLGSPPPANSVGGRIAFKTGTSYGYRDAWSVGFDGKHTVGVWVGRPDGAPVPGLTGRDAAAPVLFDAFARLGPPAALPGPPPGVLIAPNTKLPPPLRRFRPAAGSDASAVHILFPPDGARFDVSSADGKPDPVPLKVTGAQAPLSVLVNGLPVRQQQRGALFFTPDGPGFSRVTVIDAAGASDSVVVRVDEAGAAGALVRTAP